MARTIEALQYGWRFDDTSITFNLNSGDAKWNGVSSVTNPPVDFFSTIADLHDGSGGSENWQADFVIAIALWSNISAITITEVTGSTDANIYAYRADVTGQSGATAWFDDLATGNEYDGVDVADGYARSEFVFNNSSMAGESTITGDGYDDIPFYREYILLHEIGHALGLKGDVPISGTDNVLGGDEFSTDMTVMSYFLANIGANYTYVGGPGGLPEIDDARFPVTPMAYDIAALEDMYGAFTANTGNTVYDDTWFNSYDVDGTNHVAMTIVDSSGSADAIDLSGFTGSHRIDLREAIDGSDVWQNAPTIINGNEHVFIARGSEIENAVGGDGNDTIIGNALDNDLQGGAGDDTLEDREGIDSLTGGADADEFHWYMAGSGVGSGNRDIITDFDEADGDKLFVQGAGLVFLGSGAYIAGVQNQARLDSDVLTIDADGDQDTDYELQMDGVASLSEGAFGSSVIEWLPFATGNNVITGTSSAETLNGTAGGDEIYGLGGNDTINGSLGNDAVYGGEGNDRLLGATFLDSDTGRDSVFGENGDDYIEGGWGSDYLEGGDGNDTIYTTYSFQTDLSDNNVAFGGDGHDSIYGGLDIMFGEAGNDTLISIFGGIIYGGAGNDSLYAIGGIPSMVSGGDGDDSIWGSNVINGDEGADTIAGYIGSDSIAGGAGNDVFLYRTFQDSEIGEGNRDIIADFVSGDDRIGFVYDAPTFFFVNDEFIETGERQVRFTTSGGTTIVEIDYDGDGDADSEIELTGAFDLDEHDFVDIVLFSSVVAGSVDADSITATSGDDSIYGLDGNDTIAALDGLDTVNGGDGNDIIYGADDDDELRGDAGADTMYGGADDDALFGDAGADHLYGDGGNDYILGENDADSIDGGSGADTLSGGSGADTILLGDGNDIAYGSTGSDQMFGGIGDDTLYGEEDNDFMLGDNDNDRLYGGAGADTLSGGAGLDYIEAGSGGDLAYGGTGNDTIYGGDDDDFISGEDGDDLLIGDDGYDTIFGGAGNDLISGGVHDDSIVGGDDNDEIYSYAGNDIIYGGNGNDTIYGEDGDDFLIADAGNDSINGGAGNDTLSGGTEADILVAGADDDTVYGAGGNDTLYGAGGDDYLSDEEGDDLLLGNEGNDTLDGGSGQDTFSGAEGYDRIETGADNDTAYGGTQNDTLIGEGGNDLLYGEDDADLLDGSAGADTLIGGSGADVFLFSSLSDSTDTVLDIIGDFVQGTDKIDLDGLGFTGISSGSGSGATLGYSTGGGVTTIVDADSTFAIRLVGTYTLNASDFMF